MKRGLFTLSIILFVSVTAFGQFKYGADLYSRYVWRGSDFGNSPAFQPSITYTIGGLSAGFWGSYALAETSPTDSTKSTYTENDFCVTYTINIEKAGAVTACFTDYYTPYAKVPFGFYKPTNGTGAAHILEAGLSYTGTEAFPIALAYYANLSNDPDNSSYIQGSYPFTIKETTLTLTAGYTPKKSSYYVTEKAGFINLSLNVSKSVVITDKFSLPINVSYINNPSLDISYLVFGVSLTL